MCPSPTHHLCASAGAPGTCLLVNTVLLLPCGAGTGGGVGEGTEGCEPPGRGGFIHFITAGAKQQPRGMWQTVPRAPSPACPSHRSWPARALTVVAADSEMVR